MSTEPAGGDPPNGEVHKVKHAGHPPRVRLLLAILVPLSTAFALIYIFHLTRQGRWPSPPTPIQSVSLKEPESDVVHSEKPSLAHEQILRFAIAPVISPEKSLEMYNDLAAYVAGKLGRHVEVMQRRTYAEINELVRYRRCDVALVCTYPFVRGRREFGMQVLVVPMIQGKVTYHSLIVVPRTSQAASLLDLRGTRFGSSDIMSNSGWLYPATWLMEHDEDPDHFFAENVITGSHDRSVQAVVSGYVDGAAVDSLVYEQMANEDPSIQHLTRIVQTSPPFGMPPLVVHPALDSTVKTHLRQVLLGMHEDSRGRLILATLGIDKFVRPDEGLYESVTQAAEVWESRQ